MRFSAALLTFAVLAAAEQSTPPGHLGRLGSHKEPVAPVASTDEWPSPIDFHTKYMKPGIPLHIKGGAKDQPGFKLWTDEYLTEKYGDELVEVEEGKKEDRDKGLWTWTFAKFLQQYKGDMYSVSAMPKAMRHEYFFPRSLNCPAYTNGMEQLNHWFSSGGTVSVLHKDNFENINCLLDGKKELLFFNKNLTTKQLHWDNRDNHQHSKVDADRVDMLKLPGFDGLDYWRVNMEAGDCLYIPLAWYHQVRSGDPANPARNYGLNLWFKMPKAREVKKCTDDLPRASVGSAEFMKEEFPTEETQEGEDGDEGDKGDEGDGDRDEM